MKEQYTYAVARIRAVENSLLKKTDIEQVLTAKSEREAVQILKDKGFFGYGTYKDMEQLLSEEEEKALAFIKELLPDMGVFNIFLYPADFHNLKAAVKTLIHGEREGIFARGGTTGVNTVKEAVKNQSFSSLPENMRKPAMEAMDVLLKTGDGQKADMIIDKALLFTIMDEAESQDSEMIKSYATHYVSLINIKIAARCAVMKKSAAFIKAALCPLGALDISSLCSAAKEGLKELCTYLENTPYSGAAEALRASFPEFEKWCDNFLMEEIKKEKSNSFTIGPIAAYYLAKEAEIKSVRIALSGVINKLDENSVRERLRDLYV